MATGLVVVGFVWRRSTADPENPLLYVKISRISLIQAEL